MLVFGVCVIMVLVGLFEVVGLFKVDFFVFVVCFVLGVGVVVIGVFVILEVF